jgi:hypothetical protein
MRKWPKIGRFLFSSSLEVVKIIGDQGAAFVIRKLHAYVKRVMRSPRLSNMMSTTITIIPHGGFEKDLELQQILEMALAATIASLLRHGVGIILVVGHYPWTVIWLRKFSGYFDTTRERSSTPIYRRISCVCAGCCSIRDAY